MKKLFALLAALFGVLQLFSFGPGSKGVFYLPLNYGYNTKSILHIFYNLPLPFITA